MSHGSVETMHEYETIAREFFDTYTRGLLDRDATVIAGHYAVPALIVFPEQAIAVSGASQTEEFFASAFGQYDGASTAEAAVEVVAATRYSIWADVRWSYDGGVPDERHMYQLVLDGEDWKIAVLTPLDV
ncbi:hypothetical protein GCM10009720_00640 [Yaniella flava]|uniref:DUF4440 domain-containing protein n=1 Tax=Yaniella flava TaxID=287930 RepID=A0ABN2TYV2_9MICC